MKLIEWLMASSCWTMNTCYLHVTCYNKVHHNISLKLLFFKYVFKKYMLNNMLLCNTTLFINFLRMQTQLMDKNKIFNNTSSGHFCCWHGYLNETVSHLCRAFAKTSMLFLLLWQILQRLLLESTTYVS